MSQAISLRRIADQMEIANNPIIAADATPISDEAFVGEGRSLFARIFGPEQTAEWDRKIAADWNDGKVGERSPDSDRYLRDIIWAALAVIAIGLLVAAWVAKP